MTLAKPGELLSLKNIYRVLTLADYPLPSADALGREARRGLTLFLFWRDMLAVDLADTELGHKLWHVEDKRNRYLSDLFNRSHPAVFYNAYFDEMAQRVTPGFLLGLVRRFDDFLRKAGYDHQALCHRLSHYQRLVARQDSEVIPAVHTYLGELMWQAPAFDTDAERARFFCSYVLAVLSLHAFFGLKMNNGPMGRLRRNADCQPEALFAAFRVPPGQEGAAWPEVLTHTACALCREPLDEALFFGRDAELRELREQMTKGGKILLSGMGGIGKSELLRQAIRTLLRGGLFARVAFIQYEGSLMDSFLRAFTDLHGNTPDTRFSECAARLSLGPGRGLLLIDNMNTPPALDPGLEALAGFGCDIVMTSRLASLDGFRALRLDDPGPEAASQIFSAWYGMPVAQEELPLLNHLMAEHLSYHPLACMMMGSMARARHLGIRDLYNGMTTTGIRGGFVHEAREVRVEEQLRQMFQVTGLVEQERRLLRLFALLPQRSYHFAALAELMADITTDRRVLADSLEKLRYLGFLTSRDATFAMHPLIAESLLQTAPPISEFPLFWALMEQKTNTEKFREWTYADIAQHALLRSDIACDQGLVILYNTATILLEASIHDAVRRLLDAARHCLKDPAQDSPDLAFSFLTLELTYQRLRSMMAEAQAALPLVLSLFPRTTLPASRPITLGHAMFFAINLSMMPELEQLHALLNETEWRDPREAAQRCYVMGEFNLYATRDYRGMLAWGDKGLAILEKAGLLGALDAANLYHVKALGSAYIGQVPQARENIGRCKALMTDWYGDTDPVYFAAYDNSLGTAYDQAGDYDSALQCFHRALDHVLRLIPGDNGMTEDFYNNLANAYLHKGDLEKALHFNQLAYGMHSRLYQVDNLQSSLLLNNMGCIFRDSGRFLEALERFARAREIAARLMGEDSLVYAEPTMNTGRAHLLMGDREQALAFLNLELPLFEKHYGPDHPRTRMGREKLREALALAEG